MANCDIQEKTVYKMIQIYCKGHHQTFKKGELCVSCQELFCYAQKRLAVCPFQAIKQKCSSCKTHCYKEDYRLEIRKVMRYSGPRMVFYAPLLTLRHFLSG